MQLPWEENKVQALLHDWLAEAPQEKRNAYGKRLTDAYVEMLHRHGALHADPHPGNFLVDKNDHIVFLDLGCVRDYDVSFCDDLIRMLVALWKHDVDLLQSTWKKLNFKDDGVDPEIVYEWLCMIMEPLLTNSVFDFGTWKISERAIRFALDNPSLTKFAPPSQVIFYLRVMSGLRGLMHQTGVQLNVYSMSRAVAKERKLL